MFVRGCVIFVCVDMCFSPLYVSFFVGWSSGRILESYIFNVVLQPSFDSLPTWFVTRVSGITKSKLEVKQHYGQHHLGGGQASGIYIVRFLWQYICCDGILWCFDIVILWF